MKGIWELNAAILSKQYPGLLEDITGESVPNDFQTETSASGEPVLKIRGIYIHSPRDPLREGRRLAENPDTGNSEVTGTGSAGKNSGGQNSPIIILGFGLGYSAQAAAEIWTQRPLIIVEKHKSLLRLALELRDLRSLLSADNVIFVNGGDGGGVTGALSLFEDTSAGRSPPSIIRNRSLMALDEEWYAAVESRIRTWTMRDDINTATLRRFGRRWVRNLSRNMESIRDLPGISKLSGLASTASASNSASPDNTASPAAKALPVFLAAAGPGLDQTIPLLEEIHRRCIIVAVDTSLRFLLKHGIAPDFVVSVDPQFFNSRHLDRCLLERTRLIAESAVYPPVLRLPFKSRCLCSSLFPLGSFIEKRTDPKGTLGAGGSVATTAWDFARSLGAKEIWTAGLDLSFPGYKTHFRGAAFEEKSHASSGRFSPTETWLIRALRDGLPFLAASSNSSGSADSGHSGGAGSGKVLTDRRLSLYATWFENRFSQYLDIRNYSLSYGGLAITGLQPARADDLLALPERREEIDRRIEDVFTRIDGDFFEPAELQKRKERYDNAVAALFRGLQKIKTAAETGAGIAEHALRQIQNRNQQGKIIQRLDEITRIISGSEVKEVAGFLFPSEALAEIGDGGKPDDSTAINADAAFRSYLESSVRLYSSLAETTEFNLKHLERDCPAIL